MTQHDLTRHEGSIAAATLGDLRSHWYTRGSLRQHYLDEGEGSPVLMVHGNPTWSYLWRDLIRALRPTHRCLAPDHIGMGLSSRPSEDEYRFTLKSRVDDLDAFMVHQVQERGLPDTGWTLVLHDWGGPIGMAWAARHPERVARLVVLNTVAFRDQFTRDAMPVTVKVPLWLIKNTALARYLFLRHNLFARATARIGVVRRLPDRVRRGYLAPYPTPASRLPILRFVQDIPQDPGDPAWDEGVAAERATALLADRPLFVGWGGRDPLFRRACHDGWLRRFPGATSRYYRDGGHYVLEDKRDELIGEIREFLART